MVTVSENMKSYLAAKDQSKIVRKTDLEMKKFYEELESEAQ
jgi:hypothetical protein